VKKRQILRRDESRRGTHECSGGDSQDQGHPGDRGFFHGLQEGQFADDVEQALVADVAGGFGGFFELMHVMAQVVGGKEGAEIDAGALENRFLPFDRCAPRGCGSSSSW